MFKMEIFTLNGLNPDFRSVKFMKAVDLVTGIINSEEFKKWFMNYRFTQLGDLSRLDREAILARLLVTVRFHYSVIGRPWHKRWSSVIGYTTGNRIFTYRNSFDAMNLAEFASHLAHEVTHCPPINFTHAVRYSPERDHALSYAIGTYIESKIVGKI